MITATFTEFRNNAASYFDKVEQGETLQIYRNGKPSAVLVRSGTKVEVKSYWKSVKPLFDLGNDTASKMFLRNGGEVVEKELLLRQLSLV